MDNDDGMYMNDWNGQVIEEFRANDGKVGGPFASIPLLLLHHTGARTGIERISPLAYQAVDDGYAIFASKAGAATNPDWYHNLVAHPETKIEVGTRKLAVTARVAGTEERNPIWETQKSRHPNFADYEAKTDRTIPVVILQPQG